MNKDDHYKNFSKFISGQYLKEDSDDEFVVSCTDPFPEDLPPIVSSTVPLQDINVSVVCAVCGDKSTGKHYGAPCCDGCKGFFRRSIRKKYKYSCRFDRDCVVDVNQRNRCRACRLKKCLAIGMNKDAVQNERDRITRKNSRSSEEPDYNGLSTIALLTSENVIKMSQLTTKNNEMDVSSKRLATVVDISESMTRQLINLVEWARNIPAFNQLSFDDQIALLKATACEFLILNLARRSQYANGVLLLGNDCIIGRYMPDTGIVSELDISNVGSRIMDEIVERFKELNIDETEFACLKAIFFFNPHAKGLVESKKVKDFQLEVQINLEDYIRDQQYDTGRLGQMFLSLLPSLRSICEQITIKIQVANLCKVAHMDTLLQDLLVHSTICV